MYPLVVSKTRAQSSARLSLRPDLVWHLVIWAGDIHLIGMFAASPPRAWGVHYDTIALSGDFVIDPSM